MNEEKTVTLDRGAETRTIAWGENEDGTVYVREARAGALTELVFDAEERGLTLAFEPSGRYGLADVEGRVEQCPGNCFIHDFEDALLLWGISYTRKETLRPLVA